MAIVYALLATTKAGDVIMSLPSEAAGHPTHHSIGAAGLMGRLVKPVPFDPILVFPFAQLSSALLKNNLTHL